ncbi:hypothetical protein PVAP13_1NG323919 [Panicum virgatum]|uniref:Uncharacterized protein n=1 Tax=Panicum virgatum TaxID=38727 RepID=A0A8T0WXH8_PANVG|nr:hypothetical protein PVAP13_1NG323919 [Panicum virgatum]
MARGGTGKRRGVEPVRCRTGPASSLPHHGARPSAGGACWSWPCMGGAHSQPRYGRWPSSPTLTRPDPVAAAVAARGHGRGGKRQRQRPPRRGHGRRAAAATVAVGPGGAQQRPRRRGIGRRAVAAMAAQQRPGGRR